MPRLIWTAACAIMLAACTTARPTALPGGGQGYAIGLELTNGPFL